MDAGHRAAFGEGLQVVRSGAAEIVEKLGKPLRPSEAGDGRGRGVCAKRGEMRAKLSRDPKGSAWDIPTRSPSGRG